MRKSIIPTLSLIISTAALFLSFLRTPPISFDLANFSIAVLGIIITLLIAWQIGSVLNYNNEKKTLLQTIDRLKDDLEGVKKNAASFFEQSNTTIRNAHIYNHYIFSTIAVEREDYPKALLYLFYSLQLFGDEEDLKAEDNAVNDILDKHSRGEFQISDFEIQHLQREFSNINAGVRIRLTRLRSLLELLKL